MANKPARILTDRQLKGALATIKKKPKLPRNVLVRNEDDYWPALDENQREKFVELLKTFCVETDNHKHQLAIGLQSTLANLKKADEVKILVLTSEFSPRMFAKHLLSMTLHLNQRIRVFIVPKLKDLTDQLLEVPTVVFAFKSSAKTCELEKFYDQLGIHSELLRQYLSTKPTEDVSIKNRKKQKTKPETPVVLLKKIDESSRAFVPMETKSIESPVEPIQSDFISLSSLSKQPQSSDFISLSKYSDNLVSNSSLPLYRPIKIKKLVENTNRKLKKQ